jgi:hypothetical protein
VSDPGADGVGAEVAVAFGLAEFAREGVDRVAGVVRQQKEVGVADVAVEVVCLASSGSATSEAGDQITQVLIPLALFGAA